MEFCKCTDFILMKKINLLPLGVLYAKSDVGGKVKFIFNEIKNEYKGYRINLTLDVDVSD